MSKSNAVMLPPYNRSDPALWFVICESTFNLAPKPITNSKHKYHHIVSQLPPEIASLVRDILIKPDSEDPYKILKNEIIKRSGGLSPQQNIHQLLSGEELGTRKPSELLRSMRRLSENLEVPDSFMLELFLQRLPNSVKTVLAAVADLDLEKAAEIADRILEVTPPPLQINAVRTGKSGSLEERLLGEFEKLNSRLNKLEYSRSRSPARGRKNYPRSRSNSENNEKNICWFHKRFGANCKPEKCVQPCNFPEN